MRDGRVLSPLAEDKDLWARVKLASSNAATGSPAKPPAAPVPAPVSQAPAGPPVAVPVPPQQVSRPSAEADRAAEAARLPEAARAEERRRQEEALRLADERRRKEEADRLTEERTRREQAERLAEERRLELERMREQMARAEREKAQPAATAVLRRKALVIGNNTYTRVAPLENARADAQAVAQALQRAGFEVALHTDVPDRTMKRALRDFKTRVQPGDEVVFFFAGHGVQIAGTNHLLPTDIAGESEDQVRDESLQLQRVLDDMRERGAGFTLAMVDACRDNPFRGVGRVIGGRGLAPTSAASGQMIIYSAGDGQQALDRLSESDRHPNGVFTRVLLAEMTKPGLPVDRILRTVRQEVVRLARSVGREQTPALYDQAVGDFYFVK